MAMSHEMALYGVAAMAGAVGLGAGIYFLGKKWLRQRSEVSIHGELERCYLEQVISWSH